MEIRRGLEFFAPSSGAKKESAPLTGKEEEIKPKPKKIAKIFDVAITVSLAAIFLGLPIFFTGLTFQGLAFEKQIYFFCWLLVALVAWVSRGVVTGEMKIRRTPLDIPILVFLAIYILATIFSVDRWHSFFGFFGDPSRGLVNIIALVVAYYIVLSNFTLSRLKWIMGMLVTSSFIVSLWTTLALFGIQFLPAKIAQLAPLSLIGSVSGLAVFIAFMIPLLVTVLFKIRTSEAVGKIQKNVITGALLITMALHLFVLLALYAFVPWPALLIGLGFFLIYILSQIVRPAENWTWLPMVIFVVVLIILMVGNVRVAKINLPIEVAPSYQFSWQIARDALKDKFVLGSGPGTYGYDFSLYRSQDFNRNILYNLRFYQGNGLIAEVIPAMGALGTVGLALILLTFLSVVVYLLSREKEKNKVTSLGFVSSALIILIAVVLGRIEGTILLLGALVGMVALGVLFLESVFEGKSINLSLKSSPKFALTLAFVFMVVSAGVAFVFAFIGKMFVADVYAGSAARQSQITEEGSVAKLGQAINQNNREGRYYTRLAQEYMVLANNEIIKPEKERNLYSVRRYLNNSILSAVRGRDLMKNDVLAVEILSQIYENAGLYVSDSFKLAEDTYKQAQGLEPQNPNFDVKLGQIKVAMAAAKQGDEKKQMITEAKDLFQKSIDKKNDLAPGYYQLALAEEALEGLDEAISNMDKAASLDRNNITYIFNLGRLYQARGNKEDDEVAEKLFKAVLGINDKEINTHFSLGLLYEKTQRKSDAISEYRTVLDLLPEGSQDAKQQIEKMIANIESGGTNITNNLRGANESQPPVQTPEQSAEQAPQETPAP
ncbi:MAG: hypothetical protein NT136_01680 [Candidatus Moranbacteria bacterium]|nr:hypothetical protein [Candidatus Moranbacteria bacterium]